MTTILLPNTVEWAVANGLNWLNPSATEKRDAKLLFVDVETTGLDPENDIILEIGAVMTDAQGFCLAEPVHFYPRYREGNAHAETALKQMIPLVRDMHVNSGLLDDRDNSNKVWMLDIQEELADYVESLTDDPKSIRMAGSTIKFDYYMLFAFMRDFVESLHYRARDVSTLKEVCEDFNPQLYARLAEEAPAQKLHRALPDLVDTLKEYAFYVDNLIYWGDI